MSKKLHLFTLFIVLFSILTSFGQKYHWREISEKQLTTKEKMHRTNMPSTYKLFEVNLSGLTVNLLNAPEDTSGLNSNTLVKFPDANGNINEFEIYKSQMMESELAEQYPDIHNFTGINKSNPTNVIKISITPAFGMHIMGYNGDGETYYIDTYSTDFENYILYKRKDIENKNPSFQCLTKNNMFETEENTILTENQILSTDSKFRRYRLALACTTEYAAFHVNAAPNSVPKNTEAQKKAIVLAAMNVTVNRINTIYERDLSIRLVLIGNNNNIIFINSDNFSNNSTDDLIEQSQTVITNIIGTSNFDIGHTVSTGAGGLATTAPCLSNRKALGVTGTSSPVGDPFDIDYVAHEIGHQFGANHTFNGTSGSCGGGNRNLPTAAEPGSGSTIMAYAGICGNNINVQQNSDAYFHQISIREITNFLQSSFNSCATIISTANSSPIITGTSGNKTIPYGTPFILTTSATDNTPNSLTYSWEQMDTNSSTQPPVATATVGPNFRSFAATANPSRSFPSNQTVLAGTTNPNGIVSSTWETLPIGNSNTQTGIFRTLKFATTVRDNSPVNGGQTKSSDVTISVANTGPFVITYPNNITTTQEPNWSVGQQKNITWNVAGTTANGINVTHVNILMSQDNGLTYPFVLAANTPNDGSQSIIVPSLTNGASFARVKIEAVGNIFYTVSKPIGINITADNNNFEFENFNLYPNPTSNSFNISFNSTSGNEISISIYDIRGRKIKTYEIENSGKIEQEINIANYETGVYLIKIKDGNLESTSKVIKK